MPKRQAKVGGKQRGQGENRSATGPGRPVQDSQTSMVEVVLPNEANPLGNILGGRVMHLIDIAAAIAAHRHCNTYVVTASVDHVDFRYPIKVGQLIVLQSSVNRVFRTSMEVGVKVFAEDYMTGKRIHSSSAYVTFVALDEYGNPRPIPPVICETDEERRRFKQAGIRRELRLQHLNRAPGKRVRGPLR